MKRLATFVAAFALSAAPFWAPATQAMAAPVAPAAVADNPSALTVGTFNIRCANCSKHPHNKREKRWARRAPVIVDQILREGLDVVGLQEASPGVLSKGGPSQYEDLVSRLGSSWAVTNATRYNCVRDWTPTACDYVDKGASGNARIIYNSAVLRLEAKGSLSLDGRAPAAGNKRFMTWARFTQLSTGKPFYFGTAHFEPGLSKGKIATRNSQVDAAIAELNRVSQGAPTIWASDLASTKLSHRGNTGYDRFIANGFTDPLGNSYKAKTATALTYAARMVNQQYCTLNNFAKKPKRYAKFDLGAHIDYVLLKPQMTVLEWKQVLNLNAKGKFAGVIPSDHNLVKVVLQLS